MHEIVEMVTEDIVESAELLKEAYEDYAILCNEKPRLKDIISSLTGFVKNENCFMYTYKEDGEIKGVCGFLLTPSIVDFNCKQAIELACNPLNSLSKMRKSKIFIRMIEKMEIVANNIKANCFIMIIPSHFNTSKYFQRKDFRQKEYVYSKEVR